MINAWPEACTLLEQSYAEEEGIIYLAQERANRASMTPPWPLGGTGDIDLSTHVFAVALETLIGLVDEVEPDEDPDLDGDPAGAERQEPEEQQRRNQERQRNQEQSDANGAMAPMEPTTRRQSKRLRNRQ